MKKFILYSLLAFISIALFGQNDDSTHVKTGWNFGLLPVVSYNSDLGFQYGLLTNVYNYGDGKVFSEILSLYLC